MQVLKFFLLCPTRIKPEVIAGHGKFQLRRRIRIELQQTQGVAAVEGIQWYGGCAVPERHRVELHFFKVRAICKCGGFYGAERTDKRDRGNPRTAIKRTLRHLNRPRAPFRADGHIAA